MVAAGGFVWTEHALSVQMATVSPVQGARLASSSVKITCALPGFAPGRGSVSVTVDGKPVDSAAVALHTDGVEATVSLPDGAHTVDVEYNSANIFSRRLSRSWGFPIDTTAPEVHVVSPSSATILSQKANHFLATFSEDATATLLIDGKAVPLTEGDSSSSTTTSVAGATATSSDPAGSGTRSAEADFTLAQGKHEFDLTVTDALGNSTVQKWEAIADYKAPTIKSEDWPGTTWNRTSASLTFAVSDNFPDKMVVTATVDGQNATLLPTSAPVPDTSVTAKTGKVLSPTSTKKATSTTTTSVTTGSPTAASKGGSSSASPGSSTATSAGSPAVTSSATQHVLLTTGEFSEGTHDIVITAQDAAGHVSIWHHTFLVETTETFGDRPLGEGAVGKDVAALQDILTAKGLYTGKANAVYDSATAQAVASFNKSQNLPGGTTLTVDDIGLLLGSIRIDLSERKLYLYSEGKLVKTYSVAVGRPSYPTPQGHWKIITKEVNPTWNPPDSPWAAGAVPIGPGPDDPLGTRWMGLSAPGVGIHGTNEPWSIGSYASHGCIRMHVSAAEDLFDRVFVGTTVDIVP